MRISYKTISRIKGALLIPALLTSRSSSKSLGLYSVNLSEEIPVESIWESH